MPQVVLDTEVSTWALKELLILRRICIIRQGGMHRVHGSRLGFRIRYIGSLEHNNNCYVSRAKEDFLWEKTVMLDSEEPEVIAV